jgi:hypothetical protein
LISFAPALLEDPEGSDLWANHPGFRLPKEGFTLVSDGRTNIDWKSLGISYGADSLGEALLMNRKLTIWHAAAWMLFGAAACGADEVFPVVHSEPIAVRVLGGKDGKPQPRLRVVLLAGYDRRDLGLGLWREEALTDGNGEVQLSDALRNLPLLRVEVLKGHACSPDASDAAWSVERIRRDGLSTGNRCGTDTVAAAPGVFTVFVTRAKSKQEDGHSSAKTLAKQL